MVVVVCGIGKKLGEVCEEVRRDMGVGMVVWVLMEGW